jgi:hypothetical protein
MTTTARERFHTWQQAPEEHSAEEWFELANQLAEYLDDEDLTSYGRNEIGEQVRTARQIATAIDYGEAV